MPKPRATWWASTWAASKARPSGPAARRPLLAFPFPGRTRPAFPSRRPTPPRTAAFSRENGRAFIRNGVLAGEGSCGEGSPSGLVVRGGCGHGKAARFDGARWQRRSALALLLCHGNVLLGSRLDSQQRHHLGVLGDGPVCPRCCVYMRGDTAPRGHCLVGPLSPNRSEQSASLVHCGCVGCNRSGDVLMRRRLGRSRLASDRLCFMHTRRHVGERRPRAVVVQACQPKKRCIVRVLRVRRSIGARVGDVLCAA